MVKIKVEKKMNLAELIQYIIENEVRDKHYFNTASNACIEVSKNGFINFLNTFKPDDVFETVVEEEITEETVMPRLLEVYSDYEDSDNADGHITINDSIADCYDSHSLAFHRVNKDGTLTLLWTKDGGMVE